jgi:hypothetical protein
MVPHSHIVNNHSEGPCTVITEYWQPKSSMTYRGEVNPVIYMQSEKSAEKNIKLGQARNTKKVLILFNGIHFWTSTNTGFNFLKETLAKVSEICKESGYDLLYRLKPGDQTPLNAYSNILEIDPDLCRSGLSTSLEELLKNTELVIAIDDPSSALWQAIELGCAVVLIANRPFIHSTIIDGDIIESHSPEQAFYLIKKILMDKQEFEEIRLKQISKLIDLREARCSISDDHVIA